MPQVPMFNGGLPQVGAAGGSGAMVVQAPRPSMDYARTMAMATKPIEEFAGNIGKMAEVQFARDVKAQSDEAEVASMKVVNDALYGPNGYLTQRGQNAGTTYQGTWDSIQSGIDDIVGRLPQPVRDAVQSRIQERLLSAKTTMDRWNTQQTQEWHMQSSAARQQTIIEDAANHYADKDYQAKSWLSAAQELQYQSEALGLPQEVREAKMKELYTQFQATRLATWAQDDPVGAFEELRNEKGRIDAGDYAKLENGLWSQAKPILALQLSESVPALRARGDMAKLVLDRNAKSGIPVVDGLDPVKKVQLYSQAWTYMERQRAESRGNLKRAIDNSLDTAGLEGFDPNPLSRDDFINAYGEKDGVEAYELYRTNLDSREKIHSFSGLSNAEIAATVEAMKPVRGSDTYSEQATMYTTAQKAARVVLKARQADPVGAALQDQKYGLAPITSWNDPMLSQKLSARGQAVEQIAEDYCTPKALLTANEVDALNKALSAMDPAQQATTINNLVNALDVDGAKVLAAQVDKTYGTPIQLAADPAMRKAGALGLYLKGRQGLREKQPSLSIIQDKQIGMPYYAEQLNGLYENAKTRADVLDAVEGIAAGLAMETGSVDLDAAMDIVVGKVEDYNGHKIALKGVDLTDVETIVRARARSYAWSKSEVVRLPNGRTLTGDEFSRALPTAPLVPSKNGEDNQFNVLIAGQLVLDMDNKPYVVEVFR